MSSSTVTTSRMPSAHVRGASHLSRPTGPTRRRRLGPVPRRWRDLSAALGWGVVLFTIALWVGGGGIQDLGTTAGFLTSTGRLTGLVASALLLLQVGLMARIPWVEQAWGQDELTRVHRLVGFTSFTLMLAHIALITLGYAASTDAGVWGTLVDFVVTYPGMLLAVAGIRNRATAAGVTELSKRGEGLVFYLPNQGARANVRRLLEAYRGRAMANPAALISNR